MNSSDSQKTSPVLFETCRYIGLALSKIFWRIEFKGTENIPQNSTRGLLIAPNHQTYADPVWVTLPVRRKFRYMAWDAAFNWFFLGGLMSRLGAFPVNTTGKRGKLNALKKAVKFLREGETLIVFPEGEREFADGKFLPFKPGAAWIALEAEVPIMPVTIRGGNKVWAQGMKYPHFGKVEIIYHPPFEIPRPEKKADLDEHLEKINQKLVEIIKCEN
ncbi:MAG: lysophospholipid acyltransferase family protein [Pyrinomonadaceae bacterium]